MLWRSVVIVSICSTNVSKYGMWRINFQLPSQERSFFLQHLFANTYLAAWLCDGRVAEHFFQFWSNPGTDLDLCALQVCGLWACREHQFLGLGIFMSFYTVFQPLQAMSVGILIIGIFRTVFLYWLHSRITKILFPFLDLGNVFFVLLSFLSPVPIILFLCSRISSGLASESFTQRCPLFVVLSHVTACALT